MKSPKPSPKNLLLLALLTFGTTTTTTTHATNQVNIYSYRQPQLIQPMLDAFTKSTGIKVNTVYAKTGMLERLRSEGRNSPADIILTADIGRLSDLKNAALTQPFASPKLNRRLPANVRDPENHWFGITSRARIIVASKNRVPPNAATHYEDLADPQWRGRICTRSGKHPYNIALFASMIHQHGEPQAENWLRALKRNLARKPQGNDRAQVKAIAQGVCDIAIINHYYLNLMANDPKQKPWLDAIRVIFPNQDGRGTHMNISGIAITRHAPNLQNARQLLEFLASRKAQKMYATTNGEYPVTENIRLSKYLRSLGDFKRDTLALAEIAALRTNASKMVDRVRYNN